MALDETHDPGLESFVDVSPDSPFPIQNLPFGVFRPGPGFDPRVGTRIGDTVVDLGVLESRGLFDGPELSGRTVFARPRLNDLLALGRPAWREARATISRLLRRDCGTLRDDESLREIALLPVARCEMLVPAEIGDYTDFYSSRHHATNVGIMFRGPDNALMPNWLHLPVAYHGRSSSIVPSGTPVRRPCGQILPRDADRPVFGPSRLLDFELEVGFLVGPGNPLGEPIPVERAEDHIFGLVLVNDWSARDIQKWEYQPLGPFLSKNFATTVSPWVVTLEALEPFRTEGPVQDPEPLDYLRTPGNPTWDIPLTVALRTESLETPHVIARSNFRHLYWNVRQQLAHHTVTGCNVRPGDLMASGTISGPEKHERGCLLELTWRGEEPIELPDGSTRTFLLDGDEVIITGAAAGDGRRVGFGSCAGRILPARVGGAGS
ncbi:MAG: fumarylacetoacetase [Acidobacteriota bacterium]